MSIRLEIHENAISMIDKIVKINYGMGLDALDQSGIVLRDSTRRAFKSSRTQWRQSYIKGKLNIFKTSSSNILGKRVSHVNKSNAGKPDNMANLITSTTMAKSMTTVIAGKHKRFTPLIRRNGKVVGSGTSVGATTKGSYAILQKLNSGSTDTDNNDYKSKVRGISKFNNPNYQQQNFIEKGRSAAMGQVKNIMTSKLESLMNREINRANVTSREVKRA